MGNKINAHGLRLGITAPFDANWFTSKREEYRNTLKADMVIRRIINKRFQAAGIEHINIVRSANNVEILVDVAKPGMAIGRGGKLIEEVKKEIQKATNSVVNIKPKEVAEPSLSARIIARQIADAIEKRRPEKMLVAKAIERAKRRGVLGIKIMVSGRLRASIHSNRLVEKYGRVPLQTLRSEIDYALEEAYSANAGILGVKVWVYKGDKYK